MRKVMHSFEVYSNESACRKSGNIGMDQVWKDLAWERGFEGWFRFLNDGVVVWETKIG